jgi:hypothetical protein
MKEKHKCAENELNQEKEKLAREVGSFQGELIQIRQTLERNVEQLQNLKATLSELEKLQENAQRLESNHNDVKAALIAKAKVYAHGCHERAEELKAANNLEKMKRFQLDGEELKSIENERIMLEQKMTSLREKIQLSKEEDRRCSEEQTILGKLSEEYVVNTNTLALMKAKEVTLKQRKEEDKATFECTVAGFNGKIKQCQQRNDDARTQRNNAIIKRQGELQKILDTKKMKLQMYKQAIEKMADRDNEKMKILNGLKNYP